MSIVLAQQWPHKALIVTDTIASAHAGGDRLQPAGFATKIWTLPHLNMVFAFRGPGILAFLWHNYIVETAQCQDIEDVHEVALAKLEQLAGGTARQYRQDISGEFYHFGFPHGSEQMVQYRHRVNEGLSWNRVEVPPSGDEAMENVMFTVAPCPITSTFPDLRNVADYVDLVARIKDENDRLLVEDPVAIGGDLFATFVENWKIRTVRWHRFPDYDTTWDAIRRCPGTT